MNVITNEISIDLMKPTDLAEVHAVQGERNTRCVRMFLLSDGKPWQIPENTLLAIRYGGVARSGGYYDTLPDGSDAWEYDGNAITLRLTPQMMSSAGAVFVQVEMIQEDQMLATFSFKLLVAANPAVGVVEQETYVNWLQWMKNQLESHIQSLIDSGSLIGPMGPQGDPASVTGIEVVYQASNSATITPMGTWSSVIPDVPGDAFLWTRTTITFNNTTPVTFYSVARMGMDGVASVCNVTPDVGGNVPLTAADLGTLPTKDIQNLVRRAAPYNLLDNSYFRNLVNQRGQTEYTEGYTIDRWTIWDNASGGKLSITANGIKITIGSLGSVVLSQKIPIERIDTNKTYTFAWHLSDGSVNIQHRTLSDSGYGWAVLEHHFQENVEIAWCALYEGEYTLDTLPEYQPKCYGAELAECMRYYQQYDENWMSAITDSSGYALCSLVLPVPMRVKPSASYSGGSEQQFDVFGAGLQQLLCEYVTAKEQTLYIAVKATDYPNKYISSWHTIVLSADL